MSINDNDILWIFNVTYLDINLIWSSQKWNLALHRIMIHNCHINTLWPEYEASKDIWQIYSDDGFWLKHDDVIKWKYFPRNWPLVQGIHREPVTRSFDVFFDLRLNKLLSKQWWDWWLETLSRPLWRHCNVNYNLSTCVRIVCQNWFMKLFGAARRQTIIRTITTTFTSL